MCSSDCLLVIIAILFPPLPVWVKRGLCSADSLINIALCCLGFVPGLIHSWYIISATPDYYEYERIDDVESGRRRRDGNVTYYYVEAPRAQPPRQQGSAPARSNQQPQNYGAVSNGEGSSNPNEVPPSYNEAIQGDNKVQKK